MDRFISNVVVIMSCCVVMMWVCLKNGASLLRVPRAPGWGMDGKLILLVDKEISEVMN